MNGDHWIFSRVAFRSCREKRVYQIIQKSKRHPIVKQIKSNEIFEWRRDLKYQSLLWVILQKSAWKGNLCKTNWVHLCKTNRLHKLLIWGRPVPIFFKSGKCKTNQQKRWACPFRVLHSFSKIIERAIHNQLSLHMENI